MDNVDRLISSVERLDLSSEISPKKPWTRGYLKTGLIQDEIMLKHKCLWTKADECPERYECIRDRFLHYKLIDHCDQLKSQMATEEQILLAHDKHYYDIVKATKGEEDIDKLKSISQKYDGIYFNEHTYDAAMMAAGSSIKLTDSILDEKIKNGFGLIRTPGHHAKKYEADGYCFFNNAAIVAKHSIHKRGLKRVLIVDWDVHHGQGTQSFFYDDPNVMYISIHRYENGKFWPNLIESNFNFTGQGAGKGFNINIPLNEIGCNDGDFLLMWFNIILPVAHEFNPELVVVSAGFDAAIGCPEGQMRIKPITYYVLCHSLMGLANGKVAVLLEGGYNLLSLAESAAMTLMALIGLPCPKIDTDIVEMSPHDFVVRTILEVIWAIRPQWRMLCLQGSFERFMPESKISPGGDVDLRPKYKPVALYEGTNTSDVKPEQYDLDGVVCPKNESEQAALKEEIISIMNKTGFRVPRSLFEKRTFLIFDDHMLLHKDDDLTHPECPARYQHIKKRLIETGLFDRCTIGKSRKATEDEIGLGHSKSYIEEFKMTRNKSRKEHNSFLKANNLANEIYLNNSTYDCAILAAGCTIESVDKVLSGQSCNAFALIRPPGHHAKIDEALGFCIFNNVVIAANYALKNYPETCKRVLIVDYDIHHGNGTQDLVQDDERILYVSIHGYNDARFYPFEQSSNYNSGSKNIINIPWNDDEMGDSEYMLAYLSIVLPCCYEFNPDLVLVSSGFDAAINDRLGGHKVSPKSYGHFIHHLLPLASGKIVVALEGGYNLKSISEGAAHVVSILLGDPPQNLSMRPPSKSAIISMKNVISYHKSNYKLLCLDYDLPSDQVE